MSLLNFWPTRDEINKCIKFEAESALDAVLLAVHQPMPLIRRDEGSNTELEVTEYEMLKAFLSDDLPQGTLVMPITGPSGSGKSHLIRWLDAQLKRDDPEGKRRLVIRVPKSASLRDVVELILEPLSADPNFAKVRERLKKAVSEVNPAEAAISFAGALEISLNRLYESLIQDLRSDPRRSDRDEIRRRAHHAKNLPGFFNDSELRTHFVDNVLAPIIDRAVNGRDEVEAGEEEFLPQFQAEDLEIPDALHGAVGHASRSVRQYYQADLNARDGAGREQAAKVLNEVIDESIQRVFQLDQATGGVTLEAIILRVRELLFEQDRELVLLLEDFAALSGIQQVLLKVCIQEAERDGQQVRSRMRTALALTDGYLVGRDTIATRAKREWVIHPVSREEDIVVRAVDLVGAYLNAARWGAGPLKEQYLESPRINESDLTSWVKVYSAEDLSPEESDVLKAFGSSEKGYHLFPYNVSAIQGLAERHLRIGGQLQYNPRRVINYILREVLLSGREDFDKGQFPPPGFEGAAAHPVIKSKLRELVPSEVERQRIEALVIYWGGDPSDLLELSSVSEELYMAFGLTKPKLAERKEPVTPKGEAEGREREETKPEPKPAEKEESENTPDVGDWAKKLRNWIEGEPLGQQDANKVRKVLARLVEQAVPWNRLRLNKRALNNLLLTIPNARGNDGAASFKIAVAEECVDPDGELQLTLLGAVRLDANDWKLGYPEADEDSARVAILVEQLVSKVVQYLEAERERDVATLSWVLYRQAMILGLATRQRTTAYEAQVSAVRSEVGVDSELIKLNDDSRWDALRQEAADLREGLQKQLWERVGCYQGDIGRMVYAIDPTLITVSDDSDLVVPKFLSETERAHMNQLKPLFVKGAVRPLFEKLTSLVDELNNALGSDFDKGAMLSELNTLKEELISIGGWPKDVHKLEFQRQVDAFRGADIKQQLASVKPMLEREELDYGSNETLRRLGHLNLAVVEDATSFLQMLREFLGSAEKELEIKESEASRVDPEVDAEKLKRLLVGVERDLHYIGQKGMVCP